MSKLAASVKNSNFTKQQLADVIMEVQRTLIQDIIQQMNKETIGKLEEVDRRLTGELNEVKRSLEFSYDEIIDLKAKLDVENRENRSLRIKVQQLSEENSTLKTEITTTADRVDYVDDIGRRNNLRFAGVPDDVRENWESSQRKISQLLRDRFQLPEVKFDRVHRVGKPNSSRPRDIIIKFSSPSDRDKVFYQRSKLKGTAVYVNEDLCPGTTKARQQQMDKFKEARSQGKHVTFSHKTLVVRERASGHPPTHPPAVPTPSSPSRTPSPLRGNQPLLLLSEEYPPLPAISSTTCSPTAVGISNPRNQVTGAPSTQSGNHPLQYQSS